AAIVGPHPRPACNTRTLEARAAAQCPISCRIIATTKLTATFMVNRNIGSLFLCEIVSDASFQLPERSQFDLHVKNHEQERADDNRSFNWPESTCKTNYTQQAERQHSKVKT